jgi:hypothetical protein
MNLFIFTAVNQGSKETTRKVEACMNIVYVSNEMFVTLIVLNVSSTYSSVKNTETIRYLLIRNEPEEKSLYSTV